jgi:hypothetical protein
MTDKINKEQRQRFIEYLIKEAVVNVLAEQEPPFATSAVPPSPVAASPETNVQQPEVQTEPAAPEQEQFTVEAMVDKLNVLRGGRSFTDPEVFGRLTTFFNGLTDEQKTNMESTLTELGKAVIGATEEEAGLEDPQQQQQSSGAAQPPPPAPTPAAAPAPVTPTP